MTKQPILDAKLLRKFGFMVGGVFVGIGCLPVILRQETPLLWVLVVGSILLGMAVTYPQSLKPVYQVWMKIGGALGWVNTRIILMMGFYIIFTPIGLAMRLLGKDPISRRFDGAMMTYRVGRTPRSGLHMQKQF